MRNGNGVTKWGSLTEQEFKYPNACRKQAWELTVFVADSTRSPAITNRVGNLLAGVDLRIYFSPCRSSSKPYSAPAAPGGCVSGVFLLSPSLYSLFLLLPSE